MPCSVWKESSRSTRVEVSAGRTATPDSTVRPVSEALCCDSGIGARERLQQEEFGAERTLLVLLSMSIRSH